MPWLVIALYMVHGLGAAFPAAVQGKRAAAWARAARTAAPAPQHPHRQPALAAWPGCNSSGRWGGPRRFGDGGSW